MSEKNSHWKLGAFIVFHWTNKTKSQIFVIAREHTFSRWFLHFPNITFNLFVLFIFFFILYLLIQSDHDFEQNLSHTIWFRTLFSSLFFSLHLVQKMIVFVTKQIGQKRDFSFYITYVIKSNAQIEKYTQRNHRITEPLRNESKKKKLSQIVSTPWVIVTKQQFIKQTLHWIIGKIRS